MTPGSVNQLVIATVAGSQIGELVNRLTHDGFYVTQVNSSGGILHEATVSMLIGLDKTHLPRLLEHFRECCRTHRQFLPAHIEGPFLQVQPVMIEAEMGGGTLYALEVEHFEQLYDAHIPTEAVSLKDREEAKMKMIIAIIRDTDDECVIDQLITHNYRVTRVATTGGFLRRGNVTLFIGVEDAPQVQAVIDLLKQTCSPAEAGHHRATIFVVNTEYFEQI